MLSFDADLKGDERSQLAGPLEFNFDGDNGDNAIHDMGSVVLRMYSNVIDDTRNTKSYKQLRYWLLFKLCLFST